MDINQAYQFVQYVANKKQAGRITPDNFNLLAPLAQHEAIMKRFGNPKTYANNVPIPIMGHDMNTKAQDDLRTILKRDDNSGAGHDTTTTNLLAWAEFTDYLHINNLERLDGTPVAQLKMSELNKRRKSLIKPPATDYPIMALEQDGIRVYPNVTDLVLIYYRKPADPNWDYTLSGTNPVYNDTVTPGETGKISQDFELPYELHTEICMLILQHIGVNLSHAEVTQYAQMKEAQGI